MRAVICIATAPDGVRVHFPYTIRGDESEDQTKFAGITKAMNGIRAHNGHLSKGLPHEWTYEINYC